MISDDGSSIVNSSGNIQWFILCVHILLDAVAIDRDQIIKKMP